jgi:hypothetical protein
MRILIRASDIRNNGEDFVLTPYVTVIKNKRGGFFIGLGIGWGWWSIGFAVGNWKKKHKFFIYFDKNYGT